MHKILMVTYTNTKGQRFRVVYASEAEALVEVDKRRLAGHAADVEAVWFRPLPEYPDCDGV